ncbi:PAP2-domain-containing protein [Sparassis crispa]|uniref:PAP2-domain-containing protein n=1 Tax=Sparassis crispa TaxID=139825 RepID=A0A401G685_9APHY|nr:PAP2-domain-containing protein [Sparassis crispa]GBE77664.1 PAP2-domain-containing protein [Sparassis crispa]
MGRERQHSTSSMPWWMLVLDQTNPIVSSLTACFVLYTHSAGVAYFAAGAVACNLSVKVIKRFIRQPRPAQTTSARQKSTYGMPSTHTAVITYFAAYVTLACAYLPVHPSLPSGAVSRVLPVIIVLPWATTIAVSRTWLGHHTWPQVGAGFAYGLLFTPLWFTFWIHGGNHYGRLLEQYLFE